MNDMFGPGSGVDFTGEPQRDDYDSSPFDERNGLFADTSLLGRIGDFMRRQANHVVDYFTDYRSDDLMEYTTAWDQWNTDRVQHREDTAMTRRAADLRAAGYSQWFQGGGSPASGNNLGPRRLTGGQSKREALMTMLNSAMAMAQIGKTRAETESIKAQIPGHEANSAVLQRTVEARVSQAQVALTTARYNEQMAAYNVSATQAEAAYKYYLAELNTLYLKHPISRHGQDPVAAPDQLIETFESHNMREQWNAHPEWGAPPLRINTRFFNMANLANQQWREAAAQAMALAEAEHNLEISEKYSIRTNQTGWIGQLLKNISANLPWNKGR